MKTIILGEFSKRDTEMLSKVVTDYLNELGINPSAFVFHIKVTYTEERDEVPKY